MSRFVSLLSCFALALLACGEEVEPVPEPVRGVLVTEVPPSGTAVVRTFSGVAQSASTTDLSFRVQGIVTVLAVKTGDVVEEGQLIAELDATDYAIDAQEAIASLSQARAELRNAEAAYGRARALYEREGVSRDELDRARASAESGRANVRASMQRVRAAERKRQYTRLAAPSAGAISEVPVEPGENVTAGQAVAVLQTGGPPEVEVALPENVISDVDAGAVTSVSFEAFPGESFQGKVRKVGITPTGSGTTYPVTISLDAEWDRIRPGMAADATFLFDSAEESFVVVPASAVGHDSGGHYVFLVEADPASTDAEGTTRRQPVSVGDLVGDGFMVREGLRGGETIVVAGVPRIRDGTRVRVLRPGDWP